jgi:hypothetical protein
MPGWRVLLVSSLFAAGLFFAQPVASRECCRACFWGEIAQQGDNQ